MPLVFELCELFQALNWIVGYILLQHLDYEPVHTERPGELIAYYKIARMFLLSTVPH